MKKDILRGSNDEIRKFIAMKKINTSTFLILKDILTKKKCFD